MDKLELIVFSGVSGAGKTTSLSALEERGYATIMDLPGELIPGLVALMKEHPKVYGKTAISVPIVAIKEAVEEIRKDEAVSLTSIGLLASREELRKRYRLTRHSHPLEAKGLDLEECLDLDEKAWNDARPSFDAVVDTTSLTAGELKQRIAMLTDEQGRLPGRQKPLLDQRAAFPVGPRRAGSRIHRKGPLGREVHGHGPRGGFRFLRFGLEGRPESCRLRPRLFGRAASKRLFRLAPC